MSQVVEIELGEHVEVLLRDDVWEDHYGVLEVTELFEDDKVTGHILVQPEYQHSSNKYSILVLVNHALSLQASQQPACNDARQALFGSPHGKLLQVVPHAQFGMANIIAIVSWSAKTCIARCSCMHDGEQT